VHGLVAGFFAAFLAVQIVVPCVQLTKTRPTQFGWHMFSAWRPIPQYWIVFGDGATQEIDVHEHIGVRRLDADHHREFPAYLCRTYPNAVAVRWQWPGSDEIEEHPCGR
jgi:hypothetical protein